MASLEKKDRNIRRASSSASDYVTLGGKGADKGTAQHPSDVVFTPKQIEWLEQTFPEMRITPQTTMEEIQHHGGIRHVIHCMRQRVSAGRLVQV